MGKSSVYHLIVCTATTDAVIKTIFALKVQVCVHFTARVSCVACWDEGSAQTQRILPAWLWE